MRAEMESQVIASLLRQGRTLDRLSTGLTLLGVLFGLLQWLLVTSVSLGLILSAWLIVLGLLQKYWAIRVAFDADLFALIARDAEALTGNTQALDQALQSLDLQPAKRAGRPWTERQHGALRLLRIQAVLVGAQVLPTLVVILASPWLSYSG